MSEKIELNVTLTFDADLNTSAWIMKTVLEDDNWKTNLTRKHKITKGETIWSWIFYDINITNASKILDLLDKKDILLKIPDLGEEMFVEMFEVTNHE